MKKLIYNENTKEINIVEKEAFSAKGKKKPKRVKSWLENNKIYFEVFSYLFVGVMGIVISLAGCSINKQTMKIYERQLEILTDDREPYFIMNSNKKSDRSYDDSNNYNIELIYEIKNKGGLILDPCILNIEKYLSIYFSDYKIYKFKIYDFFINEYPEYDEEKETLKFYEYRSDEYDNFVNELIQEIEAYFDNVIVSEQNYVNISYVNYKNEQCLQRFKFTPKKIEVSDGKKEGIYIGKDSSYDILTIIEKIKKSIKDIEK